MANLTLPGNPRYQPEVLQPFFGYDNNFRYVAEVEIATIKTLGEIGIIPSADIALLTPEVEQKLLGITTSEVDEVERKVTRHDIRAWVSLAKERSPVSLRKWIHIPLTSYDALDTARSLQFVRAHNGVVRPLANEVIMHLAEHTRRFASQKQIGRTHGQHALPITVGFWFATVLSRILWNVESVNSTSYELVGKISGAVGAYNAQVATGIDAKTFELLVLTKLGLKHPPISTQILPPEPLADYLFSCLKLSASLGQFCRDGRNLMRSEIAELGEPFDEGQVGSSTMAHKRNPINFENLEGTWIKTKNEFGKVLDTMISDHQRDLVGSTISRDFPTIVVDLVLQLNTLLRGDPPFIARISVDSVACDRNLSLLGDNILAEPIYIALQMAGYEDDAHDLVNRTAMPLAKSSGMSLFGAVKQLATTDQQLATAIENIPGRIREVLVGSPSNYTGLASEQALKIANAAENYLSIEKSKVLDEVPNCPVCGFKTEPDGLIFKCSNCFTEVARDA